MRGGNNNVAFTKEKNKSGKLVSGAAASSHKVYKIHGGPGRQFINITAYALSGLVIAKGLHDGVAN